MEEDKNRQKQMDPDGNRGKQMKMDRKRCKQIKQIEADETDRNGWKQIKTYRNR